MPFATLDWLLVGFYFGAVALVGYLKHERATQEVDFLLSGRKLTLPAFVATLVSTWYGGILGVGEFSYQYGLSMWTVLGLPFYFFSFIYALVLAPRIRAHPALSIPEALSMQYGNGAGLASAPLVFVLVSPAPYILMLALLFQYLTGGTAPFLLYAAGVALFSMAYVTSGGFGAVVRTDVLQLLLMYTGFGFLLFFAIHEADLSTLWQALPEAHRNLKGPHSYQYLVVWFFIALWTFVDPAFHQRVAAARTPEVARRGILLSIVCWMVFDLMTLLSGLYGRYLLPALEHPAMVYPHMASRLLPAGMRGLFFVALLATIMSTLDSYLFLSGQTLGRDFLSHFFARASHIRLTRVGTVIATLLGILLLVLYPSVIQLWYVIGSVMVPGLLIPVLGVYLPAFRLQQRHVLPALLLPPAGALLWLLLGTWKGQEGAFLGVEPFYPGLLVSVLLWGWSRFSMRQVSVSDPDR